MKISRKQHLHVLDIFISKELCIFYFFQISYLSSLDILAYCFSFTAVSNVMMPNCKTEKNIKNTEQAFTCKRIEKKTEYI